ncbi:hypothetical protein AAE026_07895 [Bradyrhizobium sp. DN5]
MSECQPMRKAGPKYRSVRTSPIRSNGLGTQRSPFQYQRPGSFTADAWTGSTSERRGSRAHQRIKLQADRTGSRALLDQAEALRAEAVTDGVHFPIAPDLFGGVYMDLKVVDTVGIGAGDASFVNKQVLDAAHSETYGIAPVLNTQNTYEMVYSFRIDQGAGLFGTAVEDPFKCYDSALLKPGVTAIMLAYDAAPETLQYTRILVNGQRPLAAWLLDNAEQTWVNQARRG